MALVITGSPGTGKHAISGMAAEKLGRELVDLNAVAAESGLARQKGGELEVDAAKLARAVSDRAGNSHIIVGHLAPYVLNASQVEMALVLRRSPYELEQVYKERKYSQAKAAENMQAEILGITAHDCMQSAGSGKTVQLDTTKMDAAQAALEAARLLGGGSAGSPVDWLEEVRRRGDLARFFDYKA